MDWQKYFATFFVYNMKRGAAVLERERVTQEDLLFCFGCSLAKTAGHWTAANQTTCSGLRGWRVLSPLADSSCSRSASTLSEIELLRCSSGCPMSAMVTPSDARPPHRCGSTCCSASAEDQTEPAASSDSLARTAAKKLLSACTAMRARAASALQIPLSL